mmetsp:Transcript_42805/g.112605  ORF Transcript_42805/g.112605 Transcript_42805/m.112605 type:complete len:497 (-) Transcript_42805:676-2166(-)
MLKGFTYYGFRKLDEPMRTMQLTESARKQCQSFVCYVGGLSGVQWQAFVPALALLVTRGMHLSMDGVGQIYAVFISTSIVGFLGLPQIVKYVTPYTLLRRAFEMRFVAGLIHIAGLWKITPYSMPLVLISRAIHGFTLLLVPLNVTWIGANTPDSEKPGVLAERNTWATAGITVGILLGGGFTSYFTDIVMSGLASGWLLAGTSLATWLAIPHYFIDRRPLPTAEGHVVDGDGKSGVPWLHVVLSSYANFVGWSGYLAFEGTLSVLLVINFGLSHRHVIFGWVPAAIGTFLGSYAVSRLRSKSWSTKDLAYLASTSLLVAAVLLTLGLSRIAGQNVLDCSLFVLGVSVCLFAFGVGNTVVNAQLLVHLPTHLQATYQTPVQLMANLGRGIGPYVGAIILDSSRRRGAGESWAGTVVSLFAWASIALATFIPVALGSRFYAPPVPTALPQTHSKPPKSEPGMSSRNASASAQGSRSKRSPAENVHRRLSGGDLTDMC